MAGGRCGSEQKGSCLDQQTEADRSPLIAAENSRSNKKKAAPAFQTEVSVRTEYRKKYIMSEQENTNLVQLVYENFKSGDISALLNLLSDDVEWQLPEIENVPFAGKRRGQEQMGQFFASLVDTQEVQHFDPREFIAQGDKVVALGHYAWLVKSTGREFGGDFAHVFKVHNGKVVTFHEYMDTAAAAAAHRRDKYDEAGAL